MYFLFTKWEGGQRTACSTLKFQKLKPTTSRAGATRGALFLDFVISDAGGGADGGGADTAVLQKCAVAHGRCFQ